MRGFLSVGGTRFTLAPPGPPPRPYAPLVRALGECRRAQLLAGVDVELREHLVQVVLDRARADEQLGADLRVRVSPLRQPGHLRLLRGEHVTRLDREPSHGLARGCQLAPGAFGE